VKPRAPNYFVSCIVSTKSPAHVNATCSGFIKPIWLHKSRLNIGKFNDEMKLPLLKRFCTCLGLISKGK